MGLFEHHPARVGAIRAAGTDSFTAAKQLTTFADEVRGVSASVPLAVEGTSLVDAARRPLHRVDHRALALVPVFRLQGKAAGLWADAVDDFNWRVDMLNDVWDQANPSGWQKTTDAFMGSPLLGLLADHDEADDQKAALKRELTKRHAQLEDQLETIGDHIAKTLDAGPGRGVDTFYRFMTEAMSKAKAQRQAAEKQLSTFGDDTWQERLKHSIGGGIVAAVMGMADAIVMATPFGPGTRGGLDVPQIPARNMPSRWWERTAREHGLDTRGPGYNLAELSTIMATSLVPLGGQTKTIGQAGLRASVTADPARAIIHPDKYKYIFGGVTSGPHNARRSAQILAELSHIGIRDNATGRALLAHHFEKTVRDDSNVIRTFSTSHGMYEVRESLVVGPHGFLKFQTTWEVTSRGSRFLTVIPKGGIK